MDINTGSIFGLRIDTSIKKWEMTNPTLCPICQDTLPEELMLWVDDEKMFICRNCVKVHKLIGEEVKYEE